MPKQPHVLQCVEFDPQTATCAVQAWVPAPSLLPDLPAADVFQLLASVALCLSTAWGAKLLGKTVRD